MGAIYSDVSWSVHNSASVNGQTEAKIMNTFYREFNIINYKIKTILTLLNIYT